MHLFAAGYEADIRSSTIFILCGFLFGYSVALFRKQWFAYIIKRKTMDCTNMKMEELTAEFTKVSE